jgi:hypothetical protein
MELRDSSPRPRAEWFKVNPEGTDSAETFGNEPEFSELMDFDSGILGIDAHFESSVGGQKIG